MKRCLMSLLIREVQIRTTMRYHLIPVRMVITKKTTNTKSCQECGGKGNPYTLLWECKLVQPLWKTVWGFLKKLKIELPCDAGLRTVCQCRRPKRHGFHPWIRKIPWRREWQPIPVFLPGKSHGQRRNLSAHWQTSGWRSGVYLYTVITVYIYIYSYLYL